MGMFIYNGGMRGADKGRVKPIKINARTYRTALIQFTTYLTGATNTHTHTPTSGSLPVPGLGRREVFFGAPADVLKVKFWSLSVPF